MTWLTDLNVGDTVYFVRSDSRYRSGNKNVTVENKGRKWLTLSNGSRVDITQKLYRIYAVCEYNIGSPDMIYQDKEQYDYGVNIQNLRDQVRDVIVYKSVTDEQILAISEVLCINRT